jgi:hypothetical protein
MTAVELENILSNVPPEAEVVFQYRGRVLEIGDYQYPEEGPYITIEMN